MLLKLGVIKKLCWLNLQTHIYKWILGNFCCSHSGDLIFKHTSTIGFLTISTAPILAQSIANVYSAYDHSLLTGIGFYYGTMWTQEPKISFMFLNILLIFLVGLICCSFVSPLFTPLHIHELPKRSLNTQTCLAQTLGGCLSASNVLPLHACPLLTDDWPSLGFPIVLTCSIFFHGI